MRMLKRCYPLLALLALAFLSFSVQATPISRYARFTGNYNYVATGGSLRTQSNAGDACAVGSISTQALAGIPVGATIAAAYLYWGGSGATMDSAVTLNGSAGTLRAPLRRHSTTAVPTIRILVALQTLRVLLPEMAHSSSAD
jgi:hypothetical protein